MKRILQVLLVISLLANLGGGAVLLWRKHKVAGTRPSSANLDAFRRRFITFGAVAPKTIAATPKTGTNELTSPRLDPRLRDPRFVKAKLEAEGYPPEAVWWTVYSVIYENHGLWEIDRAHVKDPAPELRQLQLAVGKQVKDEVDEVCGFPPWPVYSFPGPTDYAKYGNLTPETMREVQKVTDDSRDKSDRDFMEALRPILTAEQHAEYLKYNTLLARQIQSTISSIDVDEATYTALWKDAVARFGSPAPGMPESSRARRGLNPLADELADRNKALGSVETYRHILGDEQFLKVVNRFDQYAAAADAVYQDAGLAPVARADLFMEAYKVREAFWLQNKRDGAPEVAASLYRLLVQKAGLNTEQVAAFDRLALGAALKNGQLGSWSGSTVGR